MARYGRPPLPNTEHRTPNTSPVPTDTCKNMIVARSMHTRRDRSFLRTMHLFSGGTYWFGWVGRRRRSPGCPRTLPVPSRGGAGYDVPVRPRFGKTAVYVRCTYGEIVLFYVQCIFFQGERIVLEGSNGNTGIKHNNAGTGAAGHRSVVDL